MFKLMLPLMDEIDSSGGGGSGSVVTGTGNSVPAPAGTEPARTQTPSATSIRLQDDSMVEIPGLDKPVKFGEHFRGLQAQFTKASQRASQLEQAKTTLERKVQDLENQARSQQRSGQPQAAAQTRAQADSLVDKIKSLPYLSGAEAAEVVSELTGRFGQFNQAISQRDQILLGLAQHLQKMTQQMGTIQQQRGQAEFDHKITNVISQLGLPEEAKDLAQEMYLAYEGDDLDQEFPAMLKNRWEQIQRLVRVAEQKRREEARRMPFVAAQGGNGSPSRPLNQGFKSAREIADAMWPGMTEE